MVRLKHNNSKVFIIRLNESQFHYGSIKTDQRVNKTRWVFSLNSTMVRLKQNIIDEIQFFMECLNSTMVRLKHIFSIASF